MQDRLHEKIARVAHEACRTWAKLNDQPVPPSWDALDASCQAAIIMGVRFSWDGVAVSELHNRWVKYMYAQGWKFGPIRDMEKRVSPNLISFEQLPFREQIKDHIFKGVVDTFREIMK